jgi:glycosyltransferase involved in cell wall biosynthesis
MIPVVIVAGDLTTWGGMDRANYELARYLADQPGVAVHVVSHFVAAPLAAHPNVVWHRVQKPFNSYACAGPWLASRGRAVAASLAADRPRVIVNGGNCAWPDVNWVHAVHAAWDTRVGHASTMVRARTALLKRTARRAERRAVSTARVVVTNSARAREQLVDGLGLDAARVHVVYYGTDPAVFRPATVDERLAARREWNVEPERRLAIFVGALGHDRNKGFDIVFDAWRELASDSAWDVDLVAAGSGAELATWQRQADIQGLTGRVRLVGFHRDVRSLMRAADLLVSPTHYDAYGLAVHEALCAGLPAIVTRTAGVAERYPSDLEALLLPDPPSAGDLVKRLLAWRADPEGCGRRVACFGHRLRQRTWTDMGRDVAALLAESA